MGDDEEVSGAVRGERGAGGSCGQLHKVSIGEIAVAEAAILNVVPHPVFKLDTPENKTLS